MWACLQHCSDISSRHKILCNASSTLRCKCSHFNNSEELQDRLHLASSFEVFLQGALQGCRLDHCQAK